MIIYHNRKEAGQMLGKILAGYHIDTPVVLAIPNGGVIVGKEVAIQLKAPFDLVVVRKIPIPDNPEAGFGSVTSTGTTILNSSILPRLNLSPARIKELAQETFEKVKERMAFYGISGDYSYIKDKTAILIDDGLASGITMEAALRTIKPFAPKHIIIAVPTASHLSFEKLAYEVDAIISPDIRYKLPFAVADAYQDWYDVSDEEVKEILNNFKQEQELHREG